MHKSELRNWLVKLKGEYIGFVLGEISSDAFEGKLYGIMPEFRGENYSREIMGFLKNMCFEEGLTYFKNDVVFQNVASLKNIILESINPVLSYFHITINPLLSVSQEPEEHKEISISRDDKSLLSEILLKHNRDFITDDFRLASFQSKIFREIQGEAALVISTPVGDERQVLTCSKILNSQKQICAYAYCRFLSI